MSLPWHLEVLSTLRWPKSDWYKETRQTAFLEWTILYLKTGIIQKQKGFKLQPLLSPWHKCSNSENAIDFTFMSFVLYLHKMLDLILLSESVQMAPMKIIGDQTTMFMAVAKRWTSHHSSKAAMMVSEPPASWHAAPLSSFPKSHKIKLPWESFRAKQSKPIPLYTLFNFFLLYYFLICIFHILS